MSEHSHSDSHYIKIWAILLVLLVVSVLGPMLGVKLVTLLTAFGIAIVKAYLVAKNFMHLNIERRYVTYLLVTCLALMAILFVFIAPDVMKHEGQQWENTAAKESVKRGLEAAPAHGEGH